MGLCDRFIYIPQYGPGTASLNVAVAASIVLHNFAVWAGYRERSRHGAKFDVSQRPLRTAPRGVVPPTPEEAAAVAEARRRARQRGSDDGSVRDDVAWIDFSEQGLPELTEVEADG
jgi:hypothetical protein